MSIVFACVEHMAVLFEGSREYRRGEGGVGKRKRRVRGESSAHTYP